MVVIPADQNGINAQDAVYEAAVSVHGCKYNNTNITKKRPYSLFSIQVVGELQVDGFAVGCFDGVLYRFADRRVRVDGIEDFVIGGFQLAAEDGFGNDLRDVIADHVGAQPFAIFGIEDDFYEPFRVADAGSLTGRC